jgi:hypothetical protein
VGREQSHDAVGGSARNNQTLPRQIADGRRSRCALAHPTATLGVGFILVVVGFVWIGNGRRDRKAAARCRCRRGDRESATVQVGRLLARLPA